MKILSLNISDSQGGASRAAYRMHSALKRQGMQISLLVKNKASIDESVISLSHFESKSLNNRIWRLISTKIQNRFQRHQWRKYPDREKVFLSDLRSVPFYRALEKLDYDILHLHWINLRFLNLRILRRIKKPIVWTLHDCWPFTGICHYYFECYNYIEACGNCPLLHSTHKNDLSYKVFKAKSKLFPSLNLHIVTPSNWLAGAARNSSLFKKFPITVIPYCIDTELFSPGNRPAACEYWNLDPEKQYVLFGAMNALSDKRKGLDLLLSSLLIAEKKFDFSNVELLIFGADKTFANINPINTPIKYLGTLKNEKELVTAYRASNIVVSPSVAENLSLVIMESLSCGVPVVGFNIGGNSDMIDHLHNGYIAFKDNLEDFAYGIHWCIENNRDGNLSKAARRKVEEEFKPEIISEKYMRLYKNLL